jgi:Fe-S-cluster containining protein
MKTKENKSEKPLCCASIDINIYDLLFPEKMDVRGLEFTAAHGIENEKLGDLIKDAIDLGNGMVKIQHVCQKLTKDGKCSIYDEQPQICKDWICGNKECDFCKKNKKA